MNDIRIDRLALTLNGVSAEIAQSAIDGLENELTRRLSVRGLDVTAFQDTASTISLPAIDANGVVDAEMLRALITDGLTAFLSPPAALTDDMGAD